MIVKMESHDVDFILYRNCSYCNSNTLMKKELRFMGYSEFFCSTQCHDKYCEQYHKGLKI